MILESTAQQRIDQEAKAAAPKVGRGRRSSSLGMGPRTARSQIDLNQQLTLHGAFQVSTYFSQI